MENMIMELPLDNGKYVISYEDYRTTATRYGVPWRDLTGDNLFYCLLMHSADIECEIGEKNTEIKELKEQNAKMLDLLDTIENDSSQLPLWLWDRIKSCVNEIKQG